MTNAPLVVRLNDVPDARLAELTRELERDLSRIGIQIQPVEKLPALGERGDPVTLGTFALALITSGAVTAIIECFKAYLSQERTLTIKLIRPDGTQVEVTSNNVDTLAIREVLEAATLTQ